MRSGSNLSANIDKLYAAAFVSMKYQAPHTQELLFLLEIGA
jgi:hypothetical protein